jgi:hypothetical protein
MFRNLCVDVLAFTGDGTAYIAGDCNLQCGAAACIRNFNTDGALDAAFGVGGYWALVVGEYTFLGVLGITLAPRSTRFTVAGACAITTTLTGGGAATVGTCIVRFGATGNVVTRFFGDTEDVYFDSNSATPFAQLPSGVLALAGYCAAGDSMFCTRMVSETGQPLNSLVSVASPGNCAYVRVIAPKNDGGLWFVNSCQEGSAFAACLVKLLAYSDIDSAFGSNGTLPLAEPTTLTPALIAVTAATVQPDGKLLIAGSCRSNGAYRCVKRYLPVGGIDTTWAASSAAPHTLPFW